MTEPHALFRCDECHATVATADDLRTCTRCQTNGTAAEVHAKWPGETELIEILSERPGLPIARIRSEGEAKP